MKGFVACVVLLLAVTAVFCKSYNGYKLMRLVPLTEHQVEKLKLLEESYVDLDFWTEPALRRPVDMNVPPALLQRVMITLRKIGLTPEVIHNDVAKLIHMNSPSKPDSRVSQIVKMLAEKGITRPQMEKIITGEKNGPAIIFDEINRLANQFSRDEIVGTFPRHDDVLTWLNEMTSTHPGKAQTEDIGTTYEGRTMRMIKIGTNAQNPIIWVDSGIHAREWLTVGTTIWIINKMLTTYNTDPRVKELMDSYTWYFLPVSNPDGYEYTHTSDRLWRKTRTRNSGTSCRGADPNRNWDYDWGVSGSSTSPCSSTYQGSSAFSEPCTINMKNAITEAHRGDRIKLYMGIHSYSQMWLTPWASGRPKPADYNELLRVANNGNAALQRVHGKRFVVGTPPDILYAASGGAYDWAKGKLGIKYAYTFELRPDGNAWNGFVVSESEIQPSGEEVWAALAQVAEDLWSA